MALRQFVDLAAIAALFIVVALAAAAFFEVADVLPSDIANVLKQTAQQPAHGYGLGGMVMTTGHGHAPLTGGARVVQLMLVGLLGGGIPSAALSVGLSRRAHRVRRRFSGGWSHAFMAGFVFQLGSIVVTSFLFLWLCLVFADLESWPWDATLVLAGLLLSIVCSAFGLRAWRALRATVYEEPLRVTERTDAHPR